MNVRPFLEQKNALHEKWSNAWIGLGGNIGDVRAHMSHALRRLAAAHEIELHAISSLYRTPPWGKTDQPWFFNAAAALTTTLVAPVLLDFCLMLERECRRERQERWGPRTLDIDLLFFVPDSDSDKPHDNNADLTLPHPRIKERAFVLLPLAEIAPSLLLDGKTVANWAKEVKGDGIEKIALPHDWWLRAVNPQN